MYTDLKQDSVSGSRDNYVHLSYFGFINNVVLCFGFKVFVLTHPHTPESNSSDNCSRMTVYILKPVIRQRFLPSLFQAIGSLEYTLLHVIENQSG